MCVIQTIFVLFWCPACGNDPPGLTPPCINNGDHIIVEPSQCEYPIFAMSPVGHLYNGFLKDSYNDPKVVAVFLNVGKSLVIVPFKHVLN